MIFTHDVTYRRDWVFGHQGHDQPATQRNEASSSNACSWTIHTPNLIKFHKICFLVDVCAGVMPIVLAWFISPFIGAAGSAILFWLLRFLVLRRPNAHKLAFWVLPPIVLITGWIDVFFVFTKVREEAVLCHCTLRSCCLACCFACCILFACLN